MAKKKAATRRVTKKKAASRMTTRPIGAPLFRFLRKLTKHNDRDWFRDHKDEYDRDVRFPLLQLIASLQPGLRRVSSHLVVDPKPVGGSMFRIHRDVRFSKDKSPYKTFAAAQFRHDAGKDVHAPCLYLHLAASDVFAGAGQWQPDRDGLAAIRSAIVEDPKRWRRVVRRAEEAGLTLEGASLSRPPRGFDAEHPEIESLKRKDYLVMRRFTEADVQGEGFSDQFVQFARDSKPFVGFLTDALGLPY